MIYKANTNQKVIALTFDDGPDRRFTPQILDVLNKHHVKGTFFLLGTRVEKYPDVAKRIQNEGHVIGNHTYWHPELTKTSVKNMKWEVKKNEEAIQSITNFKTQLFRAPYGALDDDLVDELSKMGYRGVGWSIDTEDWKSLSSKEIKQNILNDIHPGAIILMHSAGHWTQDLSGTAEALDEVIPYLRKKGYEFVTIPELWAM
ncbi:chitooligosaccharide deacetylase [Pueribacillus theae]|uniref:Chitooligosaccharide deacetylase n=2 Tax=Pueribacillus theae TaxID=2171751 RepID=A0A2U1K222_9BACI|nr:chitooligosaccharide deacetylase [Pueribacillus theae]